MSAIEFAHASKTRPIQILLVEDDDGDAKAVRRAFAKARIANSMSRAVDGIAALEYLTDLLEQAENDADLSIVLLVDVNMPRLDGHQLVRRIRQNPSLKHLTIFMLTTSNAPEDRNAAFDSHVAGYILKQNAGEDFLKLAGLLNNYWRVVEIPAIVPPGKIA